MARQIAATTFSTQRDEKKDHSKQAQSKTTQHLSAENVYLLKSRLLSQDRKTGPVAHCFATAVHLTNAGSLPSPNEPTTAEEVRKQQPMRWNEIRKHKNPSAIGTGRARCQNQIRREKEFQKPNQSLCTKNSKERGQNTQRKNKTKTRNRFPGPSFSFFPGKPVGATIGA